MDLFKFTNIMIDKEHKSCIINDTSDISNIANTFSYCLNKKKKCLITDNSKKLDKLNDEINVVLNGKIYYLKWLHLIKTNIYILHKFKQNDNFNITPNIFNIFYIQFIDKYLDKINSDGKDLISNKNSFFGIYHSFNDHLRNVDNKLYFSFNLFSFILYRTIENDEYIMGKLFPTISLKDDKIICNKMEYSCPNSFKKINENQYGIQKRKISFNIQDSIPIETHNLNKKLENLYHKNIIYNTYIIKVNNSINNCILQNLFKYIICTYPFLENINNKVIYDTNDCDQPNSSLNLFITIVGDKKNLILQIDSRFNAYVSYILKSITNYLSKLSSLNKVNIAPRTIDFKYDDLMIHLVSEIYYIIVSLIIYLPYTIKKYAAIASEGYVHANYMFSNQEVTNLYNHKNNLFDSNVLYLQSILLKTLSIFTYDYYSIMRTNNDIDILPIKSNMSNNTILNLINRSKKAELAKNLIWNTTSNLYNNISKDNIEQPYVIINLDYIETECINSTLKVYSKCISNVIPIFINVLYNDNELHVSISYKKEHANFKESFDEIINQLVK